MVKRLNPIQYFGPQPGSYGVEFNNRASEPAEVIELEEEDETAKDETPRATVTPITPQAVAPPD